MLQQTQVDRVIPKYHEFLEQFPSFSALARAARADVIRAWSPLGYNRRAVRLHELAQHVEQRGGELPREPERLRELGGLGEYTAAAVACFAFGCQVPTIDTNVQRVLGRLFADRYGPGGPTPRELRFLAREVLPAGRAKDWNQALMDLGATICTSRRPACERCPVSELCAARPALGELPTVRPLRAAETSETYRATGQFQNSSRYFRGRIVAHLSKLPPGGLVSIDDLGQAVRADYAWELCPWLADLLRGLADDGLVRLEPSEGGDDVLRAGLP